TFLSWLTGGLPASLMTRCRRETPTGRMTRKKRTRRRTRTRRKTISRQSSGNPNSTNSPRKAREIAQSISGRGAMKSLLGIFSAIVLAVMLAPALAGEAPPSTKQAEAVEALVTRAAVLIEKEGQTAAFTQFRKKDSEWLHGDTYLYAYDLKGNVLLNAAFPQREGTNIAG